MSQRNIDFGAFPDDPDADAIRTAFQKVQQNFTELYSGAGSGVTSIVAGQGIQLGGTGSPTGAVTIEAAIACVQVQSSTLALGVLGSTTDQSYVLIPNSSQILTIDLPTDIVAENIELTGNLTVAGDSTLGNTVTANYFIGDGGLLSNIVATSGSSIDNGNSNVTVLANSNVTVAVSGTTDIAVFSQSGLDVSGNVTANFFIGDGGLLSNISGVGTGNSISSGNSNVVVDANSNVRVSVSGVPNVFVVTSNSASITGNLEITGSANIGGGSGGNIIGANYITANFFVGDGGLLTNISAVSGSQLVNGNSNVVVDANGNVRTSVAGNSNIFTVTGVGANVSGSLDATGNVTAAFFIGDGGLLSNISGVGTGNAITNGTSNVVVDANGNVRTSVAGNADVVVVTGSGANISGYANVTGNIDAGNVSATNGAFTNVSGNGAALISITGANVTGTVANATYATSAGSTSTANTVTANAQPNITSVGTLTSLSVTGNLISGNADLGNLAEANYVNVETQITIGNGSGGNITGADYITANFFVGDGGLLTNISAVAGTQIVNGNSSVIVDANSNVRISAAGTADIINISNTTIGVSGNIVPSANVTYNLGSSTNRFKDLFLAGNTIYLGNLVLSDTANDFTVTGNVVSQNAELGNVVTANFFVGDGGLLSNITTATASTANTANTANIANAVVGYTKIPFVYNTSSPLNLALIPAGSVVNQVMIVINEAFSDANATLTVGTIASTSQLVSASDIQTDQVGTYVVMPGQLYLSETQVVLSITPGSSTTGNGMVIINY